MSVHVVGVRHHSPACARVVAHVLDREQPDVVLIEGPSDMNERLDELTELAHELPLALFHFLSGEGVRAASYTPFCATSPEWVALTWAARHGKVVRFMDLPAWAMSFYSPGKNRTADRVDRYGKAMAALAQRLGMDGLDGVWDHLFEQPDRPEALLARLELYFAEIRQEGDEADPGDAEREAFMAQAMAWGAARGKVVAVCGGYHKPFLERAWPEMPSTWPEAPALPPGARTGSYVVPWSHERLDSFSGYASGMPSPGWYQVLFDEDHAVAAARHVEAGIAALREAGHAVSVADRIAVEVQLATLASMRRHRVPTRSDVLDALCSAVIKEALDAPPPWTTRGVMPSTDARLLLLLKAFQGRARGRVHPDTPRPPLSEAVRIDLERHGLTPEVSPREVRLDLDKAEDRARSRVLHRLRLLGIPGFTRTSGPRDPASPEHRESWDVRDHEGREVSVLEASVYGGTLEDAARGVLTERLARGQGIGDVGVVLVDAWFVGLDALVDELLDRIKHAVSQELGLGDVGRVLGLLTDLWRHATLFAQAHHPALPQVVQSVFDRGLWLFERQGGGSDPAHGLLARAIRDALRFAPLDPTSPTIAAALFARRSGDPTAPWDLRGAAVGLRYAQGEDVGGEALRAVRGTPTASLGDWLGGLFAVTRETLTELDALLAALTERIGQVGLDPFLEALPSLRLAFTHFPPRERAAIARAIARQLGGEVSAQDLLITTHSAGAVTRGLQLGTRTEQVLATYGLLSGEQA